MAGGSRANAKSAVLAALAAGLTVQEAAKQCGVGERTIYRWKRNPDFAKAVDDARTELIGRTVGRLSDSATTAVQTLRELLSPTQPPSVRLGAAKAVLELGVRLRESEELARRIAALEDTVLKETKR